MNKVPVGKTCYCYTCKKYYHYLGITRHRAAHRDKGQDCKIMYTHGDVCEHKYSKPTPQENNDG